MEREVQMDALDEIRLNNQRQLQNNFDNYFSSREGEILVDRFAGWLKEELAEQLLKAEEINGSYILNTNLVGNNYRHRLLRANQASVVNQFVALGRKLLRRVSVSFCPVINNGELKVFNDVENPHEARVDWETHFSVRDGLGNKGLAVNVFLNYHSIGPLWLCTHALVEIDLTKGGTKAWQEFVGNRFFEIGQGNTFFQGRDELPVFYKICFP